MPIATVLKPETPFVVTLVLLPQHPVDGVDRAVVASDHAGPIRPAVLDPFDGEPTWEDAEWC
jgi:hypothetical protein